MSIIHRESSCQYFYGTDDATLWWYLSYEDALLKRQELATTLKGTLVDQKWTLRDNERINRISKILKDIDKQLADKPQ